jgi:lia operon protein LiaG
MYENINRKKAVLVLLVVMVASAVLAGILFVAQYGSSGFSIFSSDASYKNNIDEEKTSAADGIRTLTVKSTSENINIITDDSSEIRAHFYGSYASSDNTFKPKLVMEKDGDNLVVRIDNESKMMVLSFSSNLKLDVYVPKAYDKNLDITSTSGEVSSDDALKLNRVLVKTTSGNIAVKSIDAANAVLKSTSGEIYVEGNFGDLDIDSTSGNIVSENLTVASAKINSTSGEIKLKGSIDGIKAGSTSGTIIIDTDRLTKDMTVSTTSGEIVVKLPADADFKLVAKSLSGEIDCAFPVTVTGNKNHNHLEGTVGNGSCNVSLSSTSGNINIAK